MFIWECCKTFRNFPHDPMVKTPNTEDPSSILGWGIRTHVPQLKILHVADRPSIVKSINRNIFLNIFKNKTFGKKRKCCLIFYLTLLKHTPKYSWNSSFPTLKENNWTIEGFFKIYSETRKEKNTGNDKYQGKKRVSLRQGI